MKRPAGLWVDVAEVTGCHRLWVEPNQALCAFPVSDHQAAGYFLVHQEEITTLKMDQHILGPTVHGRNDPSDDAPSECGSVAESMGRIGGETPLPVEESESGTF